MEALELGTFMVSACLLVSLVEYTPSQLRSLLPSAELRRFVIGVGMGLTAVGLIYSPWGKRSGAHMNPALTLTFYRLGKVSRRDALGYVVAHFLGAYAGVAVARALLGDILRDPSVNFVVTSPGRGGIARAFLAELAISAFLMLLVLVTSNQARWRQHTGWLAGVLIALYITFEAPLSGMSMNPARTLGSAVWAGNFDGLWLYFLAPPAGMLLAAELYTRVGAQRGVAAERAVVCAKLNHDSRWHCIFCGHRPTPNAFASRHRKA